MDRKFLRDNLIRHEGIRQKCYKDTEGYWTIGIGHKLTMQTDKTLTLEECYNLLDDDIEAKEREAQMFSFYSAISDKRQAVIVEMIFQLGFSGVEKFVGMIDAIKRSDYKKAAEEMLDSRWHSQTPQRCEELSRYMENG